MQSTDTDNPIPLIDIRTATNAAFEFLMANKDNMGSDVSDIRLEEVELSDDRSRWLITLGYNLQISREEAKSRQGLPTSIIIDKMTDTLKREYRVFQVDSATGNVESMKIRVV